MGLGDTAFGRSLTRSELPIAALERQLSMLDLGVPVQVRSSPRARRLGLRVDPGARRVELVLPIGVSPSAGLRFVAAHRGWLVSRIAALPPRVPFAEGAAVPLLGVPHRIRREENRAAPTVAVGGGEIRVRGDPEHLPRRVRDHLVATARRELAHRARSLAQRVGRKVARVTVRDTTSRWGSCSAKGDLSFSWRLILAPEAVLDYVVAHEVAHLVEMNHGPRFWRLVDRLAPQSEAARRWLRRHRSRLLSYG